MNITSIIQALKDTISIDPNKKGLIAGTESVDDVVKPAVEADRSNLVASVESVIREQGMDDSISEAQIEAAKKVAIYAADPVATYERFARGRSDVDAGNEAILVQTEKFTRGVMADADEAVIAAVEAFDGEVISSSLHFSVAFNALAIKQDPVAELFYPVIVVDPSKKGITLEGKIPSIMKPVKRDISGKPTEFKKISVIKNLNNTDLFTLNANRVYPVLRDESKQYLLADQAHEVEVIDGEKITTAPIKAGVKVDLLGISQPDELIAKGLMDETDALDGHLAIENLFFYLKGKDKDGNDVEEIHEKGIKGLPAIFTYTPTGHTKDLQLDYKTEGIAWIGGRITKADGTPTQIKALQDIPEGYNVKVKINLKGDANAEKGYILVNTFELEMIGMLDANGKEVDPNSDLYKNTKAVFDTIELRGYEVEAYATNSNVRFRGKLLKTDNFVYIYTVPSRTMFRELSPIVNKGTDGDTTGLISQISTAQITLSKYGLLELNNTAVLLDNMAIDTEDFGITSKLVNKKFHREPVNLAAETDSLKSSERDEDVKAALRMKIRNVAKALYIESNYNKAFETIYPGVKPTVLVGTDTNTGTYLSSWEDELFRYEVRISNDVLVKGKVFISFGIMGANRNKEPNPLNFGFCAWSPETVIALQRQENGKVNNETISTLRFKHQTVLPILGLLEVTGIEAVSGKQPINFRNV